MRHNSSETQVCVMMPVYNDWAAAKPLVSLIDTVFARNQLSGTILLIDDGSSQPATDFTVSMGLSHVDRVEVLRLRRNLGHQRAICVGLCYQEQRGLSSPLVVMDSDGEDLADDIPRLLHEYQFQGEKKIVFAARAKRSEGLVFRLGYLAYRSLHVLLTGHHVRVGNFSVLPPSAVSALVAVPELWSHYAAAVYHAKIPRCSIPTNRGRRLDGSTHMSLVGLVVHGLSAISVFSDLVGVRLLIAFIGLSAMAGGGILAVVAIRFLTDFAVPGWATYTSGLLAILLLQSLLMAAHFSFLTLGSRNRAAFLPVRDFEYFVERCDTIVADSQDEKGCV